MKPNKKGALIGLMMICMISTGTAIGFGAAVVKYRLELSPQTGNLPDIMIVQSRLVDRLMTNEGVVGIGIGVHDGKPCIDVFLVNDSAELRAKIPNEAEGYPIIIQVTGPITAY